MIGLVGETYELGKLKEHYELLPSLGGWCVFDYKAIIAIH